MVDYTDPRAAKRELEQEAYRHYEALTGTPLARQPMAGLNHNATTTHWTRFAMRIRAVA